MPTSRTKVWLGVALGVLVLLTALTVATLTLGSLGSVTYDGASWEDTGQTAPPDTTVTGPLEDYRAACQRAAGRINAKAQISWPRTLSMDVAQTLTYRLTVDVNDTPLPPDQYVPVGEPGSMTDVRVSCRLLAKLVPTDEWLEVPNPNLAADGWVERNVNGAGLFQWSWPVTATRPGPHELTAFIRPVALETSEYSYDTAELATRVDVAGSPIQWTAYWVERNTVAAGVIGVALLGLLGFAAKLLARWRSLKPKGKPRPRRRRTAQRPAPTARTGTARPPAPPGPPAPPPQAAPQPRATRSSATRRQPTGSRRRSTPSTR